MKAKPTQFRIKMWGLANANVKYVEREVVQRGLAPKIMKRFTWKLSTLLFVQQSWWCCGLWSLLSSHTNPKLQIPMRDTTLSMYTGPQAKCQKCYCVPQGLFTSWTMKSSQCPVKSMIGCWTRHGITLVYTKEKKKMLEWPWSSRSLERYVLRPILSTDVVQWVFVVGEAQDIL